MAGRHPEDTLHGPVPAILPRTALGWNPAQVALPDQQKVDVVHRFDTSALAGIAPSRCRAPGPQRRAGSGGRWQAARTITGLVVAIAVSASLAAGCDTTAEPVSSGTPAPAISTPAPLSTRETSPSSTPTSTAVTVVVQQGGSTLQSPSLVPILVDHAVDTSRFLFGGVPAIGEQTQGYANPAGITNDALTTSGRLRVLVTADRFELVIRRTGKPSIRVWVNGQQASDTIATGYTGTSDGYILLDFGSTAQRLVEFELSGFWKVKGVELPAGASMAQPPAFPGPRAVFVSDSWGNGTNADANFDSYTMVAARALGWTDASNDGVGGSGYVAQNSPGEAFPDRLTDFTTHGFDTIVVAGSINDARFDAASVGTAAATLFDAIHAAVPTARVYVIGPCFNGTAPASIIANSDAIRAAVDARPWMGGFVQAYTWITDENQAQYIDSATHHPNTDGHAYLGALAAAGLEQLLQPSAASPAPASPSAPPQ
jgi:GDSL-like Lipase/Acylhydrolase family